MMSTNKKTVIIVDDEKDLTELLSVLLEDHYEVISFNSPQDFINYLTAHIEVPFDALVSDFNMPGMNGLEMITKCFQKGYHFPFILFSAFLEKDIIFKAIQAGAFKLLEKPSSKEELEEAIEEIIVEFDSVKLRKEIRDTIDKLREYYLYLKMIITDRIPQQELDNFFLQTNSKGEVTSSSAEEVLNSLDEKLDILFSTEESLENKKEGFYKKSAS
ncbi:MAG: response regulator [Bdellovibrionales bacterium]|nr:response regulator [Bdellovibrionales bacterium]